MTTGSGTPRDREAGDPSVEVVETVRRIYAVFDGDLDALLALLDPEVEFVNPEGAIDPGTRRGHDGIRGVFASLSGAFDEYRHEPNDFIEVSDQVVVPVTFSARGRESGAELCQEEAHLWSVRVAKAFAPYAIIVVLFSIAQIDSVKEWLAGNGVWKFDWPGLDVVGPAGKPVATTYTLNYLGATGTLLFASGLLTLVVLRISARTALVTYGETIRQFGWAIFTILCVFALSYVMNLSGQISTLGVWLAKAGDFFAVLSPVVGWIGVTVTGTDAGSNALFGNLQVTAAKQLGESPILFGAANSSGGVMAKMISPQNLAIGAAAVGMVGSEGTLFRRVFGWSLLLLALMCLLVWLQSTPVLDWMVVG